MAYSSLDAIANGTDDVLSDDSDQSGEITVLVFHPHILIIQRIVLVLHQKMMNDGTYVICIRINLMNKRGGVR